MPTRHSKRSTRQWRVSQIQLNADSTIKLVIPIHLSKESLGVEVPLTTLEDVDTLATWVKMTSSPQKNFSTTCSLASSQEAETCGLSSIDTSDNIVIKARRKMLAKYSVSSRLYCFSSLLRCFQVFYLVASFRTAPPIATVSNAHTALNNNL
jgi:hypothetical protein